MIVACLQCGRWYRFPDHTSHKALDFLLPSTRCPKSPVISRIQTTAHKWAMLKGAR